MKAHNEKDHTGKHQGPQGVDKAPGEETPEVNEQFVQQTQKNKKVDADLNDPRDRQNKDRSR